MKVFRALCNARIGRGACLSGSRIGWHLKAFMATVVYNHPPVKRTGTFSSWASSGTVPGAVWLLLLSHLRSWTKIQVLMNTAVTLTPKPATEQVGWLSTCAGRWEAYSVRLSPCSLLLGVLSENLWGFVWSWLGCTPKPLHSFTSDSAWLVGGVGCHRHPQSSWQTLFNHHQKPPSHVVGIDKPTSTLLLATKCRSSQGRVKWILLIPWDSPQMKHRPVPTQP